MNQPEQSVREAAKEQSYSLYFTLLYFTLIVETLIVEMRGLILVIRQAHPSIYNNSYLWVLTLLQLGINLKANPVDQLIGLVNPPLKLRN